jgi:hypothetical protein
MLIMTASVRRDGQLVEVPADELVPGDIVGFEAGDKVPADGRILGLYFVGLPFLDAMSSGFLRGVSRDAAFGRAHRFANLGG